MRCKIPVLTIHLELNYQIKELQLPKQRARHECIKGVTPKSMRLSIKNVTQHYTHTHIYIQYIRTLFYESCRFNEIHKSTTSEKLQAVNLKT